ncbi:HotDog domain-containing protein [Xylogone sp. PMI_703]|nr:HotDog domain-containing protein [Xylogone sp. PMI_703]
MNPTAEEKAYFSAQDWCRPLLTSKDYTLIPTYSRDPKPSTEDSLTAETLNTPETIRHCLTLYKNPTPETNGRIREIRVLASLQRGLNGGVNLTHGGLLTVLLDDAMGALIGAINLYESRGRGEAEEGLDNAYTVTAELKIKFRRPVPTPQDVEIVAWMKDRKGRKCYIDGEIRDKNGDVLVGAEALWIVKRPEHRL